MKQKVNAGWLRQQAIYTVFTHLVDENEQIMTQKDNFPVSGLYPTTEWTPGEKVVDRYEMATGPEIISVNLSSEPRRRGGPGTGL